MFQSSQSLRRAMILSLCLVILAGCGDADTVSSVSTSNEPIWKKTVEQSLEARLLDKEDRFSYFNYQNATAALENDGQGLFGLCKAAVNDKTPVDWKPFAEKWCVAAAEQSYPEAADFLAKNYAKGTFGEAKQSNADEWRQRAVLDKTKVDERAQKAFQLREMWGGFWETKPGEKPVRREHESYRPALLKITEMADDGDTSAMKFLADKYYNGYGVDQSDEAYFEWTMRAAEAGDSGAAWSLGHWYNFPDRGYRDRKKAMSWYEKSIKFGLGAYDPMHTNPIRFVGQLRAEENIKKSNRLSDDEIISRLRGVGIKGNVEDDILMCDVALVLRETLGRKLKYCKTLPRYYPRQTLRHNHSYSLRHVRAFANEVFYDDRIAEDWFQAIKNRMQTRALKGDPVYADALANECEGNLECIEKWESIAISGYEKRAAEGDQQAMYNLAAIYSGRYHSHKVGNLIEKTSPPIKDETLSAEWLAKAISQYQKAANSGDADAQFNLGFFFEEGIGVKQNRKLARNYYSEFLAKPSPQRLSYFHLSGGHSYEFNKLRESCRKNGQTINTSSIMTGNVYHTDLDDLDCSQTGGETRE